MMEATQLGAEYAEQSALPTDAFGEKTWLYWLQLEAFRVLASPEWAQRWAGGGRVITAWDHEYQGAEQPDIEKSVGYGVYIHGIITQTMPWLFCLLDATAATIFVEPGRCRVLVGQDGKLYDIPELLPYSMLLPWVTDEDLQATQ
jgi:hypothetical protein